MRRLLPIIALLAIALSAQTYVQGACGHNYSSTQTTATLAFGSPVTAGDLVVVSAGWDGAGTVTVSDSVNGTLTLAGTPASNNIGTWYFPNSAAGSDTVTTTTSVAAHYALCIAEFSGAATVSPLDGTPAYNNVASGTTITTGAVTTSNANDIMVAAILAPGSNTGGTTVASPYTLGPTEVFGNGIAYEAVSSSGSKAGAQFTVSFGSALDGSTVAFKKAASGATMVPRHGASVCCQPQ